VVLSPIDLAGECVILETEVHFLWVVAHHFPNHVARPVHLLTPPQNNQVVLSPIDPQISEMLEEHSRSVLAAAADYWRSNPKP